MTSEEAIALLEDMMNVNRIMEREWGNSMIETDAGKIVDGTLYANQHKDVADALELAIAALRAGVKDMNVPTIHMTNADRIRAMSDEELADMFAEFAEENPSDDASEWHEWLIKPVEDL